MVDSERKLYKDNLKEKKEELSKVNQQLAILEKKHSSLEKEKNTLDSTNKTLVIENEGYKERNIKLNGEKTVLREKIRLLKVEIADLDEHNCGLQERHRADVEQVHAQRKTCDNLTCRNQALEELVQKLRGEIAGLRYDNDEIRSYIVQNETDLKPVKDEEFYIQTFEEIKAEVEMWVAKQAKSHAAQMLPQSNEAKLFETLSTWGETGSRSVQFLAPKHYCGVWYSIMRSRIQLIRHLISIFLFDKIFQPFAAGLPDEFSRALVWIGHDTLSHRISLGKRYD